MQRTTVGRWMHRSLRRALVRSQSRFDNLYFCCTQKTASQWIRAILNDPIVHRRCGLDVVPYARLGLRFAQIDRPFPERTIAAHLYVNYSTYAAIPKPDQYRAFFVLRDPRDVVVSWYFSGKHSHRSAEGIDEIRPSLQRLPVTEGFCYMIDRLQEWGSFEAQRSWVGAERGDPHVKIFRYEDLARQPASFVEQLLAWLEIRPTPPELAALIRRHSFSVHAGNRLQGTEDVDSHYRKGVAGDWENHFNPAIIAHFETVTGDLVERLGY